MENFSKVFTVPAFFRGGGTRNLVIIFLWVFWSPPHTTLCNYCTTREGGRGGVGEETDNTGSALTRNEMMIMRMMIILLLITIMPSMRKHAYKHMNMPLTFH